MMKNRKRKHEIGLVSRKEPLVAVEAAHQPLPRTGPPIPHENGPAVVARAAGARRKSPRRRSARRRGQEPSPASPCTPLPTTLAPPSAANGGARRRTRLARGSRGR